MLIPKEEIRECYQLNRLTKRLLKPSRDRLRKWQKPGKIKEFQRISSGHLKAESARIRQ